MVDPNKMRIERINLSNFRCFKEAELDLGADLVAVYGRNGVGKTALFDAIEFALFGRVRRLVDFEAPLAPLRNVYGDIAGPSSVRLDFGDGTWIETSIASAFGATLRSSGSWSTHLDLVYGLVADPDCFPPRRRAESVEDMFRSTLLLSQDSIRRFVEGSPQDRASVLATLAGSAHLLRLSEKASQVADEARRRNRAASLSESEAALRSGDIARALAEASARLDELGIAATESEPTSSSILEARLAAAGFDALRIPEDSAAFVLFCEDVRTRLEERISATSRLEERYSRLAAGWGTHLSSQARLAELALELRQVDIALQDAQRSRTSAESLLTRVASELRQLRDRVSSLDRLIRASREKESLETRASDCSALLAELRSKSALEDAQVETGERDLRRIDDALDHLVAEGAALQQEQRLVRERLIALEKYQGSEAQIGNWSDRLAAIQVESTRLEADRTSNKEDAARAEEAVAREVSRAERLRGSIDGLSAVAEEKNALIARLREHVSDETCPLCGTAHDSTEALVAAVDRSLASAPIELTTLAEELSSARESRREFEARKAAADQQLERVRLAQGHLTEERESITAKLRDVEQIALELGVHHGESSDRIRECRERLRATEERLERSNERVQASREARTERAALVESAKTASQLTRQRLRDLESATETLLGGIAETSAAIERESAVVPVEHGLDRSGQLAAARDALAAKEVERQSVEREEATARDGVLHARRRRPMLEEEQAQVAGLEAEFARICSEAGADPQGAREEVTRLQEQNATKAEALTLAQAALVRYEIERRRQSLTGQVAETKTKLDEAQALQAKHQREIQRLEEGEREAKRWSDVLRGQVDATIEKTAGRHRLRIERHFKSLLPSPHQFDRVVLEFRDGELKLGIRFRGRSADEGEPRLYLSNAQANVLAISIFLSFGATKRWTRLNTLLLDDPVQHLDDLDAIAFLDTLRATALGRFGSRKQIILSTCDRNLYLMMLRKFRAIEGEGLRFRGISLVGQGPSGPEIIYDHGPPERLASMG